MNKPRPLPEWHKQSATLLVWPHHHSDWAASLADITVTYLNLVTAISAFQRVLIIAYDDKHKKHIKNLCLEHACDLDKLSILTIKTNDTWVRDYGPLVLLNDQQSIHIDLSFNAWGNQYPHELDKAFSNNLYKCIQDKCHTYSHTSITLEGGNLEFNNQSTLLTNLHCIKVNNPDKDLSEQQIINALKSELNLDRILSINIPPLKGDDTGGHIDTLARYINDKTIVYSATYDKDDMNYDCLNHLKHQLEQLAKEYALKLVPLLMPANIIQDQNSKILPANYTNFIFVNGGIIMPLYNDSNDSLALQTLRDIMPDKKVIGIDATELIIQYGSIHCATLHLPEYYLNEDWFHSTKLL